jgi:nitrite reductase/ring-hydroxylating ferredoxin subunit
MLAESDLAEGELKRAVYKETPLLLVKRRDRLYAFVETCAHQGGPLAEGRLEADTLACPWPSSRFALGTGDVVDGPSTFPQPCLEVRTRDGRIEVRNARS